MTPTSSGLSVAQVADIAGVTPRTVRHYHATGVVPEPPRDASGYRRYGSKEVVELVRAVRLRALGMSLPQIAQQAGADDDEDASLSDVLLGLADKFDAEIARLVSTRDRLRELARTDTFDQPAKALTAALQDQGVLGPADHLRAGESMAATVLDALHPDGIPGVLARATALFGDPAAMAALRPLRVRLGRLRASSTDAEIAELAADVAAVLPTLGDAVLPGSGDAAQLDLGLLELLLTDRLNPTQQRFMRELRGRLPAPVQESR